MQKLSMLLASVVVVATTPFLRDHAPADAAGTPATAAVQDPAKPQDPGAAMAEMMAKMKKMTGVGPNHAALGRFLGDWDTEMRIFMGGQASPPSKGSCHVEWLIDGRWLQSKATGSMMGQPFQSFLWIGYDNFKMSYVTTAVTSIDTAMLHSEGDLTQDGKALITYGTLDEYLTGEHDKMVRYVWRFVSDDEIVQEVHDLPIGETNTKVVEVRFVRHK